MIKEFAETYIYIFCKSSSNTNKKGGNRPFTGHKFFPEFRVFHINV